MLFLRCYECFRVSLHVLFAALSAGGNKGTGAVTRAVPFQKIYIFVPKESTVVSYTVV